MLHKSKIPQKFPNFEGVVRLLIRQKIKSYSKKLKFLPILPMGGSILPTHKIHIGAVFDGFNDFYHKSVNQTLILSEKQLGLCKIGNLRQ